MRFSTTQDTKIHRRMCRERQTDRLSPLKTEVIIAWWMEIGMAVTAAMMMIMIMIVVLLLLTNPVILCGSHPLLCYFRAQVVIILQTQKHKGKKPTVLIKVLMCGFETLKLNPSWDLLLSQLLADNAVISSVLSVNQQGGFSTSF